MSTNVPITAARGDGIGPEIREASGIVTACKMLGLFASTLRSGNGAAGYTLSQGQ